MHCAPDELPKTHLIPEPSSTWQFCPWKHPLVWMTLIPSIFFLLAILSRSFGLDQLPFWFTAAALLVLSIWYVWLLVFTLSPTESWGTILRIRLAYWPNGRTLAQSFRQIWDIALVLPAWIAFNMAIAVICLTWADTPGWVTDALQKVPTVKWGFTAVLGCWLLVLIPAVTTVVRLQRLRRAPQSRCLACGNSLANATSEQCQECGRFQTGSRT